MGLWLIQSMMHTVVAHLLVIGKCNAFVDVEQNASRNVLQ